MLVRALLYAETKVCTPLLLYNETDLHDDVHASCLTTSCTSETRTRFYQSHSIANVSLYIPSLSLQYTRQGSTMSTNEAHKVPTNEASTLTSEVLASLGNAEVFDQDDNRFTWSELTKRKRVVVIFIRHFCKLHWSSCCDSSPCLTAQCTESREGADRPDRVCEL